MPVVAQGGGFELGFEEVGQGQDERGAVAFCFARGGEGEEGEGVQFQLGDGGLGFGVWGGGFCVLGRACQSRVMGSE